MTCNVIAIDGPAASGKSTVAKGVARELGYTYVDSGALYRAVTWQVLEEGADVCDAAAVMAVVDRLSLVLDVRDGVMVYTVNGVDPGVAIRLEPVNRAVSHVAAVPDVRTRVVDGLRSMTRFGGLVVEGRDIGTAVFPEAPWKFYLDASPDVRAGRRYAEMAERNVSISAEQVGASLQKRDAIDGSRKADPLRVAEGAIVIDSTYLAAADVVALILERIASASATERT